MLGIRRPLEGPVFAKLGARAVLGVPWKVTLIVGLGMADAVIERFEGMVSYADPPLTF